MSKVKLDSFIQIILYIIGLLLLVKIILIPMVGPIKAAADLTYSQENFYQKIVEKSNAMVEVAMQQDNDEDNKELFELVFKYLTNIDISNPQTYISSQIPILDLIDIGSIVGLNEEPVVVTPTEGNEPVKEPAEPPKDNEPPYIPPKTIDPAKPLVLIYHTHTTELYNPEQKKDGNFSAEKLNLGVVKVAQELEKELEVKYGISTIHDTTVHDIPSRSAGYSKSRPTVESYLKKYPSLQIVIDLHRDGDVSPEKATAIINGQKYARTMFVIGQGNKNKDVNIALANKLNNTLEKYYKGFSRGVVNSKYKTSKYNQDLSPKCVLIEFGSNNNSLEQAVNSSKLIARALAENIK